MAPIDIEKTSTPAPDHRCMYIRDIERLIARVETMADSVEQRLDRGQARFDDLEQTIKALEGKIVERQAFEHQMRGGARLAGWLLAALGTIATILMVPHLGSGGK